MSFDPDPAFLLAENTQLHSALACLTHEVGAVKGLFQSDSPIQRAYAQALVTLDGLRPYTIPALPGQGVASLLADHPDASPRTATLDELRREQITELASRLLVAEVSRPFGGEPEELKQETWIETADRMVDAAQELLKAIDRRFGKSAK